MVRGDSTGRAANDPERSLAELERALRYVPAYAGWRSLDSGPAAGVEARFDAMPATTNAWLRSEGADRFVPETADLDADLAAGRVERIRTSGTTGPPTPVLFSQAWWDDSERASWRLNAALAAAATGDHAEAVLASPRCVGPGPADRPLSVDERTLGRLLFPNEDANLAAWTEATVRRMLREIEDHAPVVLEADPFYLAELCAHAQALSLPPPRPRVVVLTYALPSKLHLSRIARTIQAPIVSSYGSTEVGYVFMSCEEGRMHQCVSSCRVDLIAGRPEVAPGLARLLVTPFGNPWACLLRFDVGDLVQTASACACGRADGWILERMHGRLKDCTRRGDGRPVTPAELDDAIASAPSAERIVSYQLDQLGPDELRVRLTTTGPLDTDAIGRSLRDLYGGRSRVTAEPVQALRPEPSGKYVASRSHIQMDPDVWFDSLDRRLFPRMNCPERAGDVVRCDDDR
jgi:phenylacetate-coenzyme A ligase PaaK-like adenylate-forming protein